MLKFKPDRIGHGVCIHTNFGGNEQMWNELRSSKIPVGKLNLFPKNNKNNISVLFNFLICFSELCLTSNIKSKSNPDYNSHHFKEFYKAKIPIALGVSIFKVNAQSIHVTYSSKSLIY